MDLNISVCLEPSKYIQEIAELRGLHFSAHPFYMMINKEAELNYCTKILNFKKTILVTAFSKDKLVAINIGVPLTYFYPTGGDFSKWIQKENLDISKLIYSSNATNPSIRGKGVNTRMMQVFENEIFNRGYACRVSEMYVVPETEFYFKRGFEKIDEKPIFKQWVRKDNKRTINKHYLMVKWINKDVGIKT